jgi:hypothetical protein
MLARKRGTETMKKLKNALGGFCAIATLAIASVAGAQEAADESEADSLVLFPLLALGYEAF